jgi:hypothetical protein
MSDVCLVSTLHDSIGWSLPPLERTAEYLNSIYSGKIVVTTERTTPAVTRALRDHGWTIVKPASSVGITYITDSRRRVLKTAIEMGFEYTHLVDMDRVLHWAYNYPEELKKATYSIPGKDFLVFGRTKRAMETHPRNQVETEALANKVFNLTLGVNMDITAASRGISRSAAETILRYSIGRFFDSDSEWPIILSLKKFQIDYMEVEGLEWETRLKRDKLTFGDKVLDVKEYYELNPESWVYRIMLAHRIARAAYNTSQNFERRLS